MSDDESPEPEAKPADGPPLSVWLAAGTILAPSVTLFGYGLIVGKSDEWVAGLVLFIFSSLAATLLICANNDGPGLGWIGSLYCGLSAATSAIVGLSVLLLNGQFDLDAFLALTGAAGWGITLVMLIWWPATRRWCGMLPPAEPHDD